MNGLMARGNLRLPAPWPSGKAADCKSAIRRFDSDRRLSRLEENGHSLWVSVFKLLMCLEPRQLLSEAWREHRAHPSSRPYTILENSTTASSPLLTEGLKTEPIARLYRLGRSFFRFTPPAVYGGHGPPAQREHSVARPTFPDRPQSGHASRCDECRRMHYC